MKKNVLFQEEKTNSGIQQMMSMVIVELNPCILDDLILPASGSFPESITNLLNL